MLKTNACLEVKLENKVYQLHCDADSPLGCLHDALMQMKGHVVERMSNAQAEEQAQLDAFNSAKAQTQELREDEGEVINNPHNTTDEAVEAAEQTPTSETVINNSVPC